MTLHVYICFGMLRDLRRRAWSCGEVGFESGGEPRIEAEPKLDFLKEPARESSSYYAIPAGRFQLCERSFEDAPNRRRLGGTNRRAKPVCLASRLPPSSGDEIRQAGEKPIGSVGEADGT